MDCTSLDDAVLRLLRALSDHSVRFMVVGTAGITLQVGNLICLDVDLWIEDLRSPLLLEAVKSVGANYAMPGGDAHPTIAGQGLDVLDIETHMSGLGPFAEEYAHVRWVSVDDVSVPVLGLDRIVKSKIAAGRPKDLAVVSTLRDFQRTLEVVGSL